MNETQIKIFWEIVDSLTPTIEKYNDEDILLVLKVVVTMIKKTINDELGICILTNESSLKEHQTSEWISVKDRLPLKDDSYLLLYKCNNTQSTFISQGLYGEKIGFNPVRNGAEVTHWMPLPSLLLELPQGIDNCYKAIKEDGLE